MASVDDTGLYARIALSLGIGLLIGLERGWRAREQAEGTRWAGLRTFALLGLFGGLSGYLGLVLQSDIIILIMALAVALLIAVAYRASLGQDALDWGATTEMAALVTFALGLVAVRGDAGLAAALCVVVVAVLTAKRRLHGAIRQIFRSELDAFVKLLVLSVVILPFLPNRGYGPGEVLNPYYIWWMVVLIQAIAFFGHFAMRFWGARLGPLVLGFFGGLASSTAVTVESARIARRLPPAAEPMAAGIAMGTTVMYLRTGLVLVILHQGLFMTIAAPLLLGALGTLIGGVVVSRRNAGEGSPKTEAVTPASLPPPSDLLTALQFGLILAAVLLLSHYARTLIGEEALFAVSALSGLADVDAVTMAMAHVAPQGAGVCLQPAEATGFLEDPCYGVLGTAILAAVAAGLFSKIVIAGWLGSRRLAMIVGLALAPGAIGACVGFML